MQERRLTVEDIMWSWARWCWQGETPGNMLRYYAEEIDTRGIVEEHAQGVEVLHKALPHPERMIIIAEYPQRNVRFWDMDTGQRRVAARRWISAVTGATLTDQQYQIYLGMFLDSVKRRFHL
ncbi:hypothetical protein [Pigmentiphaga kullae]|uniref:Uncharacterized protein n=1 Tax=Pigmentiphaga kullae TaxID=151784 RepID=A0A4Q7NC96_9BURK|nr:hypothetical protein [Pigmentiphaga kullae]RZS80642.1 hypothetical protein EV675_3254 [Pigmentiphaga kullae]